MKIINTYLILLWKQNGPSNYRSLVEVIETEEGYYFEKNKTGFFQMTEEIFKNSLKDTIKDMPDLMIQFSKPRKKV